MNPWRIRLLVLLLVMGSVLGAGYAEAQNSADWTAMFNDLHNRYFMDLDDQEYFQAVLEHALGEGFESPDGATVSLTPEEMTYQLWLRLYENTYPGMIGRPAILSRNSMKGRPATFYWRNNRGIFYWSDAYYYDAFSKTSASYYLEQVGHYLTWVRCEIAGAPFGQNGESCPSPKGGSVGARFRDVLLALESSSSVEDVEAFARSAHPRNQSVTERWSSSSSAFAESDGQSSVTPIYIIGDGNRNRYARRAVRNLLAEGGSAQSVFSYLRDEHELEGPIFTFMGSRSTPDFQFVVGDGRLTEVKYWLPANHSHNSLRAAEFWYTVAQVAVDAIYGPLIGDDRCRDWSTQAQIDHIWLTTDLGPAPAASQTKALDIPSRLVPEFGSMRSSLLIFNFPPATPRQGGTETHTTMARCSSRLSRE